MLIFRVDLFSRTKQDLKKQCFFVKLFWILYKVDSLYLEHPLSRTSLYLEQFSRSLGHFH